MVAFTLASNAVGSIPDAERIAAAAHSVGALAWADAVHMAPHRRLRARAIGLDVQICSPYKFFGPHLGIAAIRPDLAESLPADRVRPADETPPGHRFEAGTQSHEAIAGATAAIDYLRDLGGGDLDSAFARDRGARDAAGRALPQRRCRTASSCTGSATPEGRTPTFCFNVAGRSPREVAELLGEQDIYVWDGNYYALEPMRALGIDDTGGAVRAGFLHYTTEDEVDRLLEALTDLVKGLTPTNLRSDPNDWLPLASGTLLRVRPLTVGFRALPDRPQPGAPDQRAARHHDPPVAPERPPRLLVGAPHPRLGRHDRAAGHRLDVKVHDRLREARLVEC